MKLRLLIIIILAVAAMVALGWISFSQSDSDANIKIDTQAMKEDTGKAITKGRELIDDAKQSFKEATDTDTSSPDVP